jgi:hypothetical protein
LVVERQAGTTRVPLPPTPAMRFARSADAERGPPLVAGVAGYNGPEPRRMARMRDGRSLGC